MVTSRVWLSSLVLVAATISAPPAAGQNRIVQLGQHLADTSYHSESFVEIAAGGYHTMARRADGTLAVWGDNPYGQSVVPPAQGVGLIAIAGGEFHSVALRADGRVIAWGSNNFGQSGVGLWTDCVAVSAGARHTVARRSNGTLLQAGTHAAPPALPLGVTYVEVDAGGYHTVARRSDGTVVAWGANSYGQCNVPPLPLGVIYQEVAAGFAHTLARRSDGVVVAWGHNLLGQCNVPAGLSAVELAAGGYHSLARRSDGSVAAWGYNHRQQCSVPPGSWTRISAGLYHSLGRRTNGEVVAWGSNEQSQCNAPALPQGLDYTDVGAGHFYQVARRSDGMIVAWGLNHLGQCNVPLPGSGLTYTAMAAGSEHVLALQSNGTIASWGNNTSGQRNVPALPVGTSYVRVAAGSGHSLGLRSDGTVAAWGANHSGQCNVPALPAGVTYVEVGANGHGSVARRSDGNVVAWGINTYGQATVPALPSGQTYVEVDTASDRVIARRSDGSVVAWGWNGQGQCNVPSLPAGLTYVDVAANVPHTVARRSDGTVVAWGNNSRRQNDLPVLRAGECCVGIGCGYSSTMLLVGACPAPTASTILPPTAAGGLDGATSTSLWNSGATATGTGFPVRLQSLYSAASLPPGRITISRLRWRENFVATQTFFTGGTWSNVTIDMGTAATPYSSPDPVFANNLGPDRTTVFTGSVSIAPHGGTLTPTFYVDIPLTTPFVYDSSRGDLLIDVTLQGGSWSTGTVAIVDGHSGAGALATSVRSGVAGAVSGFVTATGAVVGIDYTPDPRGAEKSTFGQACQNGAFYEQWSPAASFDLSGSAIRMTSDGSGGYTTTSIPLAFVPPTSAPLTVLGLPGHSLDDGVSVPLGLPFAFPLGGTVTASIHMGTNGFIWLDGTFAQLTNAQQTDFSATAGELLALAPRLAVAWGDWHMDSSLPHGNGSFHFDIAPNNSVAYATWSGAGTFGIASQYGGPTASTFQCKLFPDGTIEYHWVSVTSLHYPTRELVVGIKTATGTNVDPGRTDLSSLASSPLRTFGTTTAGLRLDASGRPRLGALLSIDTTNIPAGATLTGTYMSFTRAAPSVELSSGGMPACWNHLPPGSTLLGWRAGQPSVGIPLLVPPSGAVLGTDVYLQSVSQVVGINAAGLISSNGLRLRIGV